MRIKHPEQTAKNDLLHKIYLMQIEKLSHRVCGKVLDVGCGQMPYADLFANVKIIGVDIGSHKGQITASGEALPFQNNIFDSAICFQTLEHVKEPKLLFREVFRVLKPKGILLLTVPFMWGVHSEPYDYYRYTPYGLRYLAEDAGFAIESVNAVSGFWLLTALRLNYYLSRIKTSLLNPLFWLTQRIGACLDSLDIQYKRRDTVGYIAVLIKPKSSVAPVKHLN